MCVGIGASKYSKCATDCNDKTVDLPSGSYLDNKCGALFYNQVYKVKYDHNGGHLNMNFSYYEFFSGPFLKKNSFREIFMNFFGGFALDVSKSESV